jgi:hypothetical protein
MWHANQTIPRKVEEKNVNNTENVELKCPYELGVCNATRNAFGMIGRNGARECRVGVLGNGRVGRYAKWPSYARD